MYLSSCIDGYFALTHEEPAVIEVDTDYLDGGRLLPDEDFVEQVTRGRRRRGRKGWYTALGKSGSC